MRLPWEQWKILRFQILVRDNFLCKKCQRGGRYSRIKLNVHHKDGNHNNNDPSNLETLCVDCHDLVTYGHSTKREKYFALKPS